jgi:hypothetical protein
VPAGHSRRRSEFATPSGHPFCRPHGSAAVVTEVWGLADFMKTEHLLIVIFILSVALFFALAGRILAAHGFGFSWPSLGPL